MHICLSKLTIIGSDNGLPSIWYQAIIWSNTGILLIRNKLQWNLNQNSSIFIQENAFENVVWKMAAILSRPQCVKKCHDSNIMTVNKLVIQEDKASIDQSHRYWRPQAACREPAGSYDKTTRTAICFDHKTQYLLIRAPYTRIVVFWHISNITPMIWQSQLSCNTPTFYIAAIFVKYCYTTGSWLL